MTYKNINEGIFISRPNRFIANVEVNGKTEACHVKNTGRCKELLVPGTKVFVSKTDNPNRVTQYDLVSLIKGERFVNIDSQAPNKVFHEHLKTGKYISDITLIKPETKYGNSRFDFYVETANRKIFIEVKGVTLEHNNIASFPDAPTERGIKHINELISSTKEGFEGHVVFIIKMKGINYFEPNHIIHEEFAQTLKNAKLAGVKITASDCIVTKDSLVVDGDVEVRL